LMAENGGLIPGYQEGTLPKEWAWIDEDIRETEGISLEQAEELMVKKYGKTIQEMKALVEEQKGGFFPRIKERRRLDKITYEELLEERKKGGSPEALREKQLIEAIQGSEGWGKEGFLTKLGRIGGELSILKDPKTMALIRQYEKSQESVLEEPGQEANGVTPAVPTTGAQGPSGGLSEEQVKALIKKAWAEKGVSPEAEATTQRFPEIVAAEKAVTDLIEGHETEGKKLEAALDVSKLTARYDTEVADATVAITVAKTAIGDAIAAQRGYIEEQEGRIPELARVASKTERTRGVGSGQQATLRRLREKEIALNMRQKISGKKQALSVIEGNMASLEKQAQEARRNQNVQALMDIERQQILLIAELQRQTLDNKHATRLAVAEAGLQHTHKMVEIRLDAELGGGVNSSAGERIMATIIEDWSTEFIPGTRIPNPNYIANKKKRANAISKIRNRAAGIGVTGAANSPESILAKEEDTTDAIKMAAERGWWDALRNIMPIFDGQRKILTGDSPQGESMTFEEFYTGFKNAQTTKQRAPKGYMDGTGLTKKLNDDLDKARNLTIEELYYIWTQAAKV